MKSSGRIRKKQETEAQTRAAAGVRLVYPPLWPNHDLQWLRSLESLAKDCVSRGDFSDGIRVDHISAVGQRVAKGDLKVSCARLQRKVFVADGRRSSVFGDGDDHDGQIEDV